MIYNNSMVEIIRANVFVRLGAIQHAVFDHDGTISTLRNGWEGIMGPVMIKAITGGKEVSTSLLGRINAKVQDFIDTTTGVQTILQMEGLVQLVDEFDVIPKSQILDKTEYKEIYNSALLKVVNRRINDIRKGASTVDDYIIRGAPEFLESLKDKEIQLYLASGTDQPDVVREAELLGYADLFQGRIYGSVGDVTKYSKRLVINNIIRNHSLSGNQLMVLGDGPVEIQECNGVGGISVGVASDENSSLGINAQKRERLIKSGADMVIPDFSSSQDLLNLLFDPKSNHEDFNN